MKAIVQDRYGSPDVLKLKDIDGPEVKDNEVLVRVHAAALHAGDTLLMKGQPYVFRLCSGCSNQGNGSRDSMWQGSFRQLAKT
jgi:NADPH:quinone reductase-like Zn-dependent oxidoreductase